MTMNRDTRREIGADQEWAGHERRTRDPWRDHVDARLVEFAEGLGQIMNHLGEQDKQLADGRKIMQSLVDQTQSLVDETREVRTVVVRTRWTANAIGIFAHWVAVAVGWLLRTLHVLAKWLGPIAGAIAAVWAIVYAYTHGGKPPP